MAKNNNRPIIIAAAVLGFLAIAFTLMRVVGGGGKPAPGPQPTPTPAAVKQIVASNYIPPRTIITADMIKEESVSQAQLVPNAITDKTRIIGKLANGPVEAGQLFTADLLTSPLHRAVPANIPIPSGFRAVAVYVDPNQTAASQVDAGDRVDVVATHKLHIIKDDDPDYRAVTRGSVDFTAGRTIAQNLLVLGVDKSINAPPPAPTPPPNQPAAAPGAPPAPTPTPTPAGPPTPAPTKIKVLLAATPSDAERIIAAADSGTINLTIRNPLDDAVKSVAEAREYPSSVTYTRKKTVASGGGRPSNFSAPVMPPPMLGPVKPATIPGDEITVIRGTEKTRVIIPNGGGGGKIGE